MQGTRMLTQAVACQPNRVATISGERRRTWREIGQRVPRLAAALRALGIQDGAFVAALAMNSDRYVELFFAVPWARAAFAPLNIRWSVAENAYALIDPVPTMQAIAQHGVTNMVLVPTMINMLVNHPDFDHYDLSSLKT